MVFSNSFNKMLSELRAECTVCNALYGNRHDLINDELDYITMRGTMISYLPAGREHLTNDDGRWRREGRQEGKPARIVQKILPDSVIRDYGITDSALEKFTNLIRSYVMANGDGENGDSEKVTLWVCNGDLIAHYYDEDNYSQYAGGNLSNSCMRSVDKDYFYIYTMNPDKVSMVVALDAEHKVLGRALLWDTDDAGLCMDTIYSKDDIRPMFFKFAHENGIRYKGGQSCHHPYFDMKDGISTSISTTGNYANVTLKHWDFDYYPYLDTLCNLDLSGVLTNRTLDEEYRSLRNTDGSYDTKNSSVEDVIDGSYIREDNATYVDYRFEGRWYTGYTECHTVWCEEISSQVFVDHATYVDGHYYLNDSDKIVYVDTAGEYYHIDDVVYDEYGDPIPYDDAVEDVHGNWICLEDAVETSEGWVLEEECEEVNGVWVRKCNNQNQNQEA